MMVKLGASRHEPIPIGDVATPAFVRLPDPRALFERRAARFRKLAEDHDLRPYLLFLAGLSDVQHAVQADLLEPDAPEKDALARAREFGMPPLDRNRFLADPAYETTLDRLASLAGDINMPQAAAIALAQVSTSDPGRRDEMVEAVLAMAIPVKEVAEHGFVTAALQVHFARLAAGLDASALVPVGDGACPVCGGAPAASMVVGWIGAHGARYCGCSLCGTLWNYVRIKCTLCASTKGIAYQEIDGGPGIAKAETCANCRGYVKILQQDKDPGVDVIADDVASLGLDLLMRDTEFRRGGVNPFLVGY
jgi:FdhE protein